MFASANLYGTYFAKKSLPNIIYDTCEILTQPTLSPERVSPNTTFKNSTPQKCLSPEVFRANALWNRDHYWTSSSFLVEMTYYIAAFISIYAVCVPLGKERATICRKVFRLKSKTKLC